MKIKTSIESINLERNSPDCLLFYWFYACPFTWSISSFSCLGPPFSYNSHMQNFRCPFCPWLRNLHGTIYCTTRIRPIPSPDCKVFGRHNILAPILQCLVSESQCQCCMMPSKNIFECRSFITANTRLWSELRIYQQWLRPEGQMFFRKQRPRNLKLCFSNLFSILDL